jgi:nucleotide-binding universal stress UspA family protein
MWVKFPSHFLALELPFLGEESAYLCTCQRNTELKPIKKILVPTDFSELSLAGIDPALLLARTFDAEILMAHVVDGPARFPFHRNEHVTETPAKDEHDRAASELDRFVRTRLDSSIHVRPVVRRGEAASEIIALSNEESVDLIIIATHGRTGLVHALLGSVAESVVRGAKVPVMTVKPDYVRGQMLESGDVEEQLHIRP